MNQFQKDIKTALSWKSWVPYEKTHRQDVEAFKRLQRYIINDDIQFYCRLEMQQIINEAIKNERTELGKSVLKQLKEALEL